jgi:hypothetical protein
VTPVVEIPVFARIAKLPAVPRFTGVGPAAMAADTIKASISPAYSVIPRKHVRLFKTIVEFVVLVFITISIELVKVNYNLFCCVKNPTVFSDYALHTEAWGNENIYALIWIHTLSIITTSTA